METLDWTKLAGTVTPDNSRIPFEPNKHLFKKIAFDVFQLSGSPAESLWILEEGDDGSQYLVAQYGDEDGGAEKTLEVKSNWAALSDNESKNVTLTYKNTPIQRFASADYGFTSEDIHVFQDALVKKLASDDEFVHKFLDSQTDNQRNRIVSQFPELYSEKKK